MVEINGLIAVQNVIMNRYMVSVQIAILLIIGLEMTMVLIWLIMIYHIQVLWTVGIVNVMSLILVILDSSKLIYWKEMIGIHFAMITVIIIQLYSLV